jgi:hypothetical protein
MIRVIAEVFVIYIFLNISDHCIEFIELCDEWSPAS